MPIFGFDEGKNKEEVVTAEEGKGLSTNDYTDEEKAEVAKVSGKQNQHSTQVITLPAANWSNGSQTISVTGVTATNTVLVSPAPINIGLYAAYGIICTAQGAGTLTFTCDFTPSSDMSVNVVILGV